MTENKIKLLILDSELMPWSALGRGLIDKTFATIDYAIGNELNKLKKYGFEEKYTELVNKMKTTEFVSDLSKKPSKELNDKYGMSLCQTYKALVEENKQHVNINILKQYYELYHKQIEIYGGDSEIKVKPFGILKMVYDDDTEIIPGHSELPTFEHNGTKFGQTDIFALISSDQQYIVDFEKGFEQCVMEATEFYNKITNEVLMEGVVIKPDFFFR